MPNFWIPNSNGPEFSDGAALLGARGVSVEVVLLLSVGRVIELEFATDGPVESRLSLEFVLLSGTPTAGPLPGSATSGVETSGGLAALPGIVMVAGPEVVA
jgi:hypothetical protein